MTRRVAHAGSPAIHHTTLRDGAPIGPRGIAFLHRVSLALGPYRLATNADRDAIERALGRGLVVRDGPACVRLTDAGRDFLHRMRSAH